MINHPNYISKGYASKLRFQVSIYYPTIASYITIHSYPMEYPCFFSWFFTLMKNHTMKSHHEKNH